LIKKKIVLTFDYELFFGERSGSIEKCLLEPTKKLLDVSRKNNIKMTFFVDVLFYQRLLEVDSDSADKIKKQLQLLVKNGHRIELHLHPHWLDAVYKNNNWIFENYRYYRIHNLDNEKIIELFVKGKQILEDIAREIDKNYNVIAFRAGGFCIQPFDKLKKAFKESGLLIDSSVVCGIKGESVAHWFDFRSVPNKEFYRFSDNVEIEKDDGEFIEFPISTYRTYIFNKIIRKIKKLKYKKDFKIYGDGKGMSYSKNFLGNLVIDDMFSLENVIPSFFYELCENYNKEYINIISHPKSLSFVSFANIECLIESKDFLFLNIFDFYKEISKKSCKNN